MVAKQDACERSLPLVLYYSCQGRELIGQGETSLSSDVLTLKKATNSWKIFFFLLPEGLGAERGGDRAFLG